MKLTFEHQGRERTLTKHADVVRKLAAKTMSPAEAKPCAWFIRVTIAGGKQEWHKLPAENADAIREAKDLLKHAGSNSPEFRAFREAKAAQEGVNLGALALEWFEAGLPFSKTKQRDAAQASEVREGLERALKFPRWEKAARAITTDDIDDFVVWRCKQITARNPRYDGKRTCDKELAALSELCKWSLRLSKLDKNPFAGRRRYQEKADVAHFHEFMPRSDEEFHRLLSWFWSVEFDQKHLSHRYKANTITDTTRVAGAWLCFTALVGLRPEEPVFLMRHARHTTPPPLPRDLLPGTIFPTCDGKWKMRVVRMKRGQNPFVILTPAALAFLGAWEHWLGASVPAPQDPEAIGKLPWFPNPTTPTTPLCPVKYIVAGKKPKVEVNTTVLTKRLLKACAAMTIGHKLKPKGVGRAFYVCVRRSQGMDDAEIATELGQGSNGKMIREHYGNPEDQMGGSQFDWQAENEKKQLLPYSWTVLTDQAEQPANVIKL